jgi:anti-sigma regulatory factor (Ser/Thr protein kinase)
MRSTECFPPVPSSVSAARHWVRALLQVNEGEALARDAELCVSELAANAVRHARTDFEVEVTDDAGVVRVAVRDESSGPVRARSAPAFESTGRGLSIVDAISRCWGVIDDPPAGKTVWFTLGGVG